MGLFDMVMIKDNHISIAGGVTNAMDFQLLIVISLAERNHIKFIRLMMANLQAEKAITKGRFRDLCATAIMLKNPRHPLAKWDDDLELALLRPDIETLATLDKDSKPSTLAIGEALFFATLDNDSGIAFQDFGSISLQFVDYLPYLWKKAYRLS